MQKRRLLKQEMKLKEHVKIMLQYLRSKLTKKSIYRILKYPKGFVAPSGRFAGRHASRSINPYLLHDRVPQFGVLNLQIQILEQFVEIKHSG